MTNTNATAFRKSLFTLLEQTIRYNEPLNISTKNGNAVLLSEQDYLNLMATLEISENKPLHDAVKKGIETPLDECVPEDEVPW